MKITIVAVRDRAIDAFARPFFVQHVGASMRSFQDEINRKADDNPIAAHPEDYDLYELGSFDEDSGKLESLERPRLVAVGKDMVKP